MKKIIYVDYQSTTPTDPEVIKAMLPYFNESYGNPSSHHFLGIEAKQSIERVKNKVAKLIGAKPYEIFFTSGATEGNNLAIKGLLSKKQSGHIITVLTEHKSVLNVCKKIELHGYEVTYLNVDKDGLICLEQLENSIRKDTVLISVMFGNNEIGTIQSIKDIGVIAKKYNLIFHSDVTQGIGYYDINVQSNNIDILTFSAHKIYGPKGIGVIYIKNDLINKELIDSLIDGGCQQRCIRSGTLNVPGIIGLGKAVELIELYRLSDFNKIKLLRDKLYTNLVSETKCILNGSKEYRLPNNLNLSFIGVDGQAFMERLSDVAFSSGSACNSESQEPSYVLKAIGVPDNLIKSTIRLSLGRPTNDDEIDRASDMIIKAYKNVYSKL